MKPRHKFAPTPPLHQRAPIGATPCLGSDWLLRASPETAEKIREHGRLYP